MIYGIYTKLFIQILDKLVLFSVQYNKKKVGCQGNLELTPAVFIP
jgi:hypothetical protein